MFYVLSFLAMQEVDGIFQLGVYVLLGKPFQIQCHRDVGGYSFTFQQLAIGCARQPCTGINRVTCLFQIGVAKLSGEGGMGIITQGAQTAVRALAYHLGVGQIF